MIVDAHIHIFGTEIRSRTLLARMDEAGVDRVGLLSEPPEGFTAGGRAEPWEERLSRLMEWRSESDRFYPLFWIDPTAGNAREQVTRAAEAGVSGFKIIADHFYPGAPEAMSTYQDIAAAGKPILFHSGILWDGKVSSQYNRPVAFEPLIRVPRLRFALAHVSWPWHDECLALYGKFAAARKQRGEEVPEMFIDLTPGTPPIFRQEVLTKLCTIDYDIMGNLVFGTDTMALDYDVAWANSWIERDARILTDLEIPQHLQEAVMGGNFLRFLGE